MIDSLPGSDHPRATDHGRASFALLSPTIFHEPWYLKAATGDRYQEARIEQGGTLVGRFPYVIRRQSLGRVTCCMPQLTHFLGPAIAQAEGSAANATLKRDKTIRSLIEAMPPASGFSHKLHAGFADTLVFQELGYNTSVQFTYEIDPAPLAVIWSQMRDKTRNAIRLAEKSITIEDLSDGAAFCALYRKNLAEVQLSNAYDTRDLIAVCDELVKRKRGRILAARRHDGVLVAAIVYLWDARASYYLLSTRSREAGNGAVSLLLWRAIADTVARGLIFDFDGIATHGSRLFFLGFGGRVVPRYIVFRYASLHRGLDKLQRRFVDRNVDSKYF